MKNEVQSQFLGSDARNCQGQSSKRKLHGSILGVCGTHWPFLLPSIARSLPLGLYARAMSSGFATKAGRSRRFGPNPRPDFSGDFYPASREIKQERRST